MSEALSDYVVVDAVMSDCVKVDLFSIPKMTVSNFSNCSDTIYPTAMAVLHLHLLRIVLLSAARPWRRASSLRVLTALLTIRST